ncbi:uncharacterized protein LOC119769684 [Culex quinquefasciatus]|uniref:uncharacterized protein LOC119769684 n=1 Tax=Culex quinquefasciatus TaxID=7176 RepID=UPI0018E2BC35|nr:uncharacterized protein LOC119769684 [Culex quinquefasciatus]
MMSYRTRNWTKAVPTRRRPKQPPKSGRGMKRTRTESEVEASLLEERQEARAGTASEPGRLVVLYGAVVRPKVLCRQGHKGDNKFMMLFVAVPRRPKATTSTGYAVARSPGSGLCTFQPARVSATRLRSGRSSQQWPAFRRVVLLAVVCARPSSSPRFRNSTVFRRAVYGGLPG